MLGWQSLFCGDSNVWAIRPFRIWHWGCTLTENTVGTAKVDSSTARVIFAFFPAFVTTIGTADSCVSALLIRPNLVIYSIIWYRCKYVSTLYPKTDTYFNTNYFPNNPPTGPALTALAHYPNTLEYRLLAHCCSRWSRQCQLCVSFSLPQQWAKRRYSIVFYIKPWIYTFLFKPECRT